MNDSIEHIGTTRLLRIAPQGPALDANGLRDLVGDALGHQAEWIAIPESFLLTASALAQARFALSGLEVDAVQMKKNLDISKGLIVAESVMMALAPYVGKHQAHEEVYDACRKVHSSGQTLADVLMQTPAVTQHLSDEQIQSLTNPANYLGKAPEMVVQALNASARI